MVRVGFFVALRLPEEVVVRVLDTSVEDALKGLASRPRLLVLLAFEDGVFALFFERACLLFLVLGFVEEALLPHWLGADLCGLALLGTHDSGPAKLFKVAVVLCPMKPASSFPFFIEREFTKSRSRLLSLRSRYLSLNLNRTKRFERDAVSMPASCSMEPCDRFRRLFVELTEFFLVLRLPRLVVLGALAFGASLPQLALLVM